MPVQSNQGFNEVSEVCQATTKYATTVMSIRQNNVPLTEYVEALSNSFYENPNSETTTDSVAILLQITAWAYNIPVYSTNSQKNAIIKAFANYVQTECGKSKYGS